MVGVGVAVPVLCVHIFYALLCCDVDIIIVYVDLLAVRSHRLLSGSLTGFECEVEELKGKCKAMNCCQIRDAVVCGDVFMDYIRYTAISVAWCYR